MATFVVRASFSDQGIKNVKQTIERADTPLSKWPRRPVRLSKRSIGHLGRAISLLFAKLLTMRPRQCSR
jgi:hypothetical protein